MIPRRAPRALGSFVLAIAAAGAPSPRTIRLKACSRPTSSSVWARPTCSRCGADIQKKLNEIRNLSSQLKLAVQQQEAFKAGANNKEAMIQELYRTSD